MSTTTAQASSSVANSAPTVPDGSVLIKTRQGQHTVLQRLVGLFPGPLSSPSGTPTYPKTGDGLGKDAGHTPQTGKAGVRWEKSLPLTPDSRRGTVEVNLKALKVRMVTWNMHDSVPKGDLEELFGTVPPYNGLPSMRSAGTFPVLPLEAEHPYHFVVVAGQECPSSSGLPMALGAGFKLIDKEKEKDKDKDKNDKDELEAAALILRLKEKEMDQIIKSKISDEPEGPPSGWTSTVEDWLCNGGNSRLRAISKTPKLSSSTDVSTPKAAAMKRVPSKEPKKGPYQFLVKERLMGIYLAIYIHRDLKPLVRGISKSAVTAGLIGGRVGNKGAVGISINLDGTTLLFLNAHLAAHEGRVSHRLANLEKIKTELEVDDFLAKDDPRKASEDLTDRFDHTFLCGDLNFRLDITRLHADWLIARQDYAQALTFDQLQKLMKEGAKELSGFKEAPINFAPTFKYDVLRTLKRQKRAEDDDEFDPDAEAVSISSISTSYSRGTELDLNNTSVQPSPSTPTMATSASKLSLSHVISAQKTRIKLLALKSPLFTGSPTKPTRKVVAENGQIYPSTPLSAVNPTLSYFPQTPRAAEPTEGDKNSPLLPPPPKIKVESTKSNGPSPSQEEVPNERGVYDSSHKKRVPSWCDRILWKTTVEQGPTPEVSPEPKYQVLLSPPPRKSSKVSRFFANLRPRSAKNTRERRVPASAKLTVPTDSLPPCLPPLKTAPPLTQAVFFSPPATLNKTTFHSDKGRVQTVPAAPASAQGRRLRRSASATSHPPSAPALSERPNRRSTAFGVLMSPLSGGDSATPSRWRFLPSFLSPTLSHHHADDIEEEVTPLPTPTVVHRKGDVICLDYNTLDDREMRRLEGRSDHRPVLGTFVVYL